jgi:secreted PhoX family phosphatase
VRRSGPVDWKKRRGRTEPDRKPHNGEIIAARFSRRDFLRGSLVTTVIASTVSPLALVAAGDARSEGQGSRFDFKEVEAGVDANHHVAEGYDADMLPRWGDGLFPDLSEFDPIRQTPEAQARQFGYNNDYVGYIPINGSSEHGYLVVNHEYTNKHLMFPSIVKASSSLTRITLRRRSPSSRSSKPTRTASASRWRPMAAHRRGSQAERQVRGRA